MSTAGKSPEAKGAGGQVTTIFTTVTQGGPRCLFFFLKRERGHEAPVLEDVSLGEAPSIL
jgi:hypothetical protein